MIAMAGAASPAAMHCERLKGLMNQLPISMRHQNANLHVDVETFSG
jgi:hypothetical protein